MRDTLEDKDLQDQLTKDGYVVVDLLDEDSLGSLRDLWDEAGEELQGFHSTIHCDSIDRKKYVDEQLRSVLSPRVEKLFDRHRCVVANYVAKAAGPGSEMPEHLDWTMVIEPDVISVGVWAPLSDTSEENGGLRLIRRSHRTLKALSGTPHFPDFGEIGSISDRFAEEDRITLDLKAGQAVIYDHRVIHYSPPNNSKTDRIAVNVAVVPRETRTFHHHLHPDGRVERFQVDDSFYVNHNIDDFPQGGLSFGFVRREFNCEIPENGAGQDAERRVTFSDPELQAAFALNGYVKVPLISSDEVAQLATTWEKLSKQRGPGFHASMYSDDRTFKADTDAAVRAVLAPALERWLEDHVAFVGNFVVKGPGPESEVGPHQDWTFVDESKYCTMTVWCPLTDTDDHNGTLRVVPGSHRWVQNPRGTPIDTFPFPFEGLREPLRERDSVPIAVQAGEAIIADHRLVHGSQPNLGDGVRIVAACGAAPAEAQLRHMYFVDDGVADVYAADDPEFFNDLVPGVRPDAEPMETVEFRSVDVSQEMFDRWLGRDVPAETVADREEDSQAQASATTNTGAEWPATQAHPPTNEPTLRRRVWNVMSWDQRDKIHRAWRRLPDPVRQSLDLRRDSTLR